MKKRVFVLMMILPLLLQVPGCALLEYPAPSLTTPIDIALQNHQVNDFMNKYPNATTSLDYYPESEISTILSMIKKDCNNMNIDAQELYRLILSDPASKLSKTVWIDWRDKSIKCVI